MKGHEERFAALGGATSAPAASPSLSLLHAPQKVLVEIERGLTMCVSVPLAGYRHGAATTWPEGQLAGDPAPPVAGDVPTRCGLGSVSDADDSGL